LLCAQTDDAAKKEEAAKRLREMQHRARAITAYKLRGDVSEQVELIPDPLLRFNDPTRDRHDGTVWAWGQRGRPIAVLTLELNPHRDVWYYELVSLSTDSIAATQGDRWRWSPQEPGLDLQVFRHAPAPADTESGRLRQLKDLARRFTACEFWRSERRSELRLLPQPMHRYSDPDSAPSDGGIFILAHGTNPEIILVIELGRERSAAPTWRYGLARLSAADLSVSLDDREVWRATSSFVNITTNNYWNIEVPIDGAEK
jgi:hypothetical protein